MGATADRPAGGASERLLGRFLAAATVGVVLFVAGLALDAWLHGRDPGLASREGPLSVGNPGHALFLAGVLLTAAGVLGAGWVLVERRSLASGRAVRPRRQAALLATAAVAVLGLTAAAGWAASQGQRHGEAARHRAAGAGEGGQADKAHKHDRFAPAGQATPEQRDAARALLDRSIQAAARWRDPAVARADGYRAGLAKLRRGETRFLHAGNPALRDDGATLDPRHPESLIYARGRGGEPVLVGVLYVAPTGQRGPTPAGPLTSWHTHTGCVDPVTGARQPRPKGGGACPDGLEPHEGREMLHVWFTDRLQTAFARRAPVAELLAWQRANGG